MWCARVRKSRHYTVMEIYLFSYFATNFKTNHHYGTNKNKRLGIILWIYEEKKGCVDELLK